jgi:hypothetical protein
MGGPRRTPQLTKKYKILIVKCQNERRLQMKVDGNNVTEMHIIETGSFHEEWRPLGCYAVGLL